MSESLGIRLNTDHLVCFQTLMGSVTPYAVRCHNRDSSVFYLILALYHILMPLETDVRTGSILFIPTTVYFVRTTVLKELIRIVYDVPVASKYLN